MPGGVVQRQRVIGVGLVVSTDMQAELSRCHHGTQMLIRIHGLEEKVGRHFKHAQPIVRCCQRGVGGKDFLCQLHQSVQLFAAMRVGDVCLALDICVGRDKGLQLEDIGQVVNAALPGDGEQFGVVGQIIVCLAQQSGVAARCRCQAVVAVGQRVVQRHVLGIVALQPLACHLHLFQQRPQVRFGIS